MGPPNSQSALTAGFLPALLVGAVGAFLFFAASLPLPFVLGPMYLCLGVNMILPRLTAPRWVRSPAVAVIGVMLGTTFRPELLHSLGRWVLPLIGLVIVIAATVSVNYLYYRLIARFEKATAFYSSAPGGLTEMVLLGGQSGGSENDIALAHSSRILVVVMILPWVILYAFGLQVGGALPSGQSILSEPGLSLTLVVGCVLVGAIGARHFGFPAPAFVGPMICSALLHLSGYSSFDVPAEAVIIAQIILGISVGVGFLGIATRIVLRAILLGAGASILMLAIGFTGAWVVSAVSTFDVLVLLLAFAPGGFPEMSLMAYALGLDVAIVASFHVFRIAIVLLAVPAAYKLLNLWANRKATGGTR